MPLPDHQMVEYVRTQQLACFYDLVRDGDVFRGGGGVARGVVVGDDDGGVLLQSSDHAFCSGVWQA